MPTILHCSNVNHNFGVHNWGCMFPHTELRQVLLPVVHFSAGCGNWCRWLYDALLRWVLAWSVGSITLTSALTLWGGVTQAHCLHQVLLLHSQKMSQTMLDDCVRLTLIKEPECMQSKIKLNPQSLDKSIRGKREICTALEWLSWLRFGLNWNMLKHW